MDCDILVNYEQGYVEKNTGKIYFEGDALMYAGIFAEKELYECQLNRLMKRTSNLALLYQDKASFISKVGCNSNLKLSELSSVAEDLTSSANLASINYIVEDIKDIEYSEGKKVGKAPSKKLLNRKKEKAKLEEEKANLEKEIEFYKGLDYSSKLFANENIFKMVYAAFIEADNKIKKLGQLKNKYNHIKLASYSQSVENMINSIKVDFDNKYGEFIY